MAYQALYNKYRPQTFDEVVGQKSVITTLKNAIKDDKIAHAYLFCGPRGTGKTSLARLFAKALNCSSGLGKQCLECDSCKAIASGDHPDVVEIDAASNSTVDSVRQLIENVSYRPIMSRYKIYIIDEVHNMSNNAFNALLKTLEEPPSFVIFILCTTEPQKIIPTILSRVQRFDFSKVSKSDLISNMERVLKGEKMSYDKDALSSLADLSDGGVRDSLSLLDQLVSYCDGSIKKEDVDSLFGLLSLEEKMKVVELIKDGNKKDCIHMIRDRYARGMDIIRFHNDLIEIFKDLLIYKTTNDSSLLSKISIEQAESLPFEKNVLLSYIKTLIDGRREYRNSDNLLSNLEFTIMSLGETREPIIAKEENIPSKNTKVFASKPVEYKAVSIETETPKKEEKKKKEMVKFSKSDILNLMNQASKDERILLAENWSNLNKELSTDNAYLARALLNSKLRVVAIDVLLITSTSLADIRTLTTMEEQKNIRALLISSFGKKYNIVCITERELQELITDYKNQESKDIKPCEINFGEEKKETASTEFFNDLFKED